VRDVKHKKIIATVVVACVAVTTAIFFLAQGEDSIFENLIHKTGEPRYDYTGGVTMSQVEYISPVYNNITGDYRPKYENMFDEEYEWIFGDLPEFPKDFFSIVNLVQEGRITDYSRISERYWKQPEFYTGWFSSIKVYLKNDPDSWITEGYGCYPAIKEGTAKKGTSLEVSTYFKTSYATESYQGIIVRPYFPENALNLFGTKIFEQPEDVEKYLGISISNPDDALYNSFKDTIQDNVQSGDWMTILKPTYRTINDEYGNFVQYKGFPNDWVRLLNLSVDIASNTPTGDYVVAIKILPPSFSINQEYYYSDIHDYYGSSYIPGGNIFRTNIPHFQFILHVE